MQHVDRVEDLLEATEDDLGAQPALARHIRAATPPLVIREHVVLRRLRAEPTGPHPPHRPDV